MTDASYEVSVALAQEIGQALSRARRPALQSAEIAAAAIGALQRRADALARLGWQSQHFPIARFEQGQCRWMDGLLMTELGEALGLESGQEGKLLGALLHELAKNASGLSGKGWKGLELSASEMLVLTH